MSNIYPYQYGQRLTNECRTIFNDHKININLLSTSNVEDINKRKNLNLKHDILIGGAVYKMSIDKNAIFHIEYKKLEQEYNEINK